MAERRLSGIDRRSVEDRRRVYDIDYFFEGGIERRSWKDRRWQEERIMEWTRISEWASVPIEKYRKE